MDSPYEKEKNIPSIILPKTRQPEKKVKKNQQIKKDPIEHQWLHPFL